MARFLVYKNPWRPRLLREPQVYSPSPPNAIPAAAFSTSATGLRITFTDLSTDADGTIHSWFWNFGDGNTSSLQNPVHTYATPGSYNVSLTVTDNVGAASQTVVALNTANLPPTANAGPDQVVIDSDDLPGESVTLDGSGSSDVDGSIVSYQWTWAGGSASGVSPVVNLPDGVTVVTLTVTDNAGATDTDTVSITVDPPVVATGLIAELDFAQTPGSNFYITQDAKNRPLDVYADIYIIDGRGVAEALEFGVSTDGGLTWGSSTTFTIDRKTDNFFDNFTGQTVTIRGSTHADDSAWAVIKNFGLPAPTLVNIGRYAGVDAWMYLSVGAHTAEAVHNGLWIKATTTLTSGRVSIYGRLK